MSIDATKSLHCLTPADLKKLSRQQKVELLSEARANGTRDPTRVLLLATDLLAGGSSGLSTVELYEVYETVLVAALECGKVDSARNYLNLLEKKFGRKSSRVNRLRGLCLEAEGKWAEAKELYKTMLKEIPTYDFPVKRLSAMWKSEGNLAEAIHVLEEQLVYTDEENKPHRYLKVHRGDSLQTYRELCILYYLSGDLSKAIFYAEEALLFSNDSYFSHTHLAELYYAKKEYAQCVAEYAQSLRLNQEPNNARAAYGLWQAAGEQLRLHHAGVHRLSEKEAKMAQELREFAAETLRGMYAGSSMLSALDAFLQRDV